MNVFRDWSDRLATTVERVVSRPRGRFLDEELDEEIQAHLEMAAEEYMARGMSPEEARRTARRDFGGMDQVKERHREARRGAWLTPFLSDVRISVRSLRRTPGFAIVVALTLTIGIGANGSVFAVVDGLLLKPLPFDDPGELVVIWEDRSGSGGAPQDEPTVADVRHWQESAESLDGLTYFWPSRPRLALGAQVAQLQGAQLTANTLQVLGVSPALGRGFLPDETVPGGPSVALLSHGMWVSRFGSDPAIVGRSINLDEVQYKVIGVMPETFRFPRLPTYSETPDILIPFQRDPGLCSDVNSCFRVSAIGRLAADASLDGVRAELATLAMTGTNLVPGRPESPLIHAVSLREQTVASFRPFALVLLGMTTLLLVVSCANVTNLFLARGEVRRGEIGLRGFLGASRVRLLGHLLTEGLVLGALGGILALVAAALATPLLVRMLSEVVALPRETEMIFDGRAGAFLLLLSLAAGLVTGSVAAVRTLRCADSAAVLELRGRGGANRRRSGLLRSLAMAQIAGAFVLILGTGLLYEGVRTLLARDRGFEARDLLAVQLPLTGSEYQRRADNLAFLRELSDRVMAMPGVEAVAATSSFPLDGDGGGQVAYRRVGGPEASGPPSTARFRGVTPEYFTTMGIELVRGRGFDDADRDDTPRIAIINEAMARRSWPGEDPVGERLALGTIEFEIVGIVSDVLSLGLDRDESPVLYRPLTQGASDYTTLMVRRPAPEAVAPAIREEIRRLGPRVVGVSITTMRDAVQTSVTPQSITVRLTAVLGLLALCLAALGVYALIHYQVTQDRPEIGVRMALGSSSPEIMRMVLSRGAKIVVGGLALGMIAAGSGSAVLSSVLYGVSPWHPSTYLQAALFVAAMALIAVFIPAVRASRTDPAEALRSD